MSRELLRAIDFCSVIQPTSLVDYAMACMYRFAVSEEAHLYQLILDIKDLIGDDLPVGNMVEGIPLGFLDSPPIVQSLIEAMQLKGPFEIVNMCVGVAKLTEPNRDSNDKRCKVQSTFLKVMRPSVPPISLQYLVAEKLRITFGDRFANYTVLGRNWYCPMFEAIAEVRSHVRMCWLKTVVGAWTTTCRMEHGANVWQCIFGCEAPDSILHYVACPILWSLACSVCGGEESIVVAERLCLINPSPHQAPEACNCSWHLSFRQE